RERQTAGSRGVVSLQLALLGTRLLLAALFATAGLTKLVNRGETRRMLAEFGVPDPFTASGALFLPLAELAGAVALVPVATRGRARRRGPRGGGGGGRAGAPPPLHRRRHRHARARAPSGLQLLRPARLRADRRRHHPPQRRARGRRRLRGAAGTQ